MKILYAEGPGMGDVFAGFMPPRASSLTQEESLAEYLSKLCPLCSTELAQKEEKTEARIHPVMQIWLQKSNLG